VTHTTRTLCYIVPHTTSGHAGWQCIRNILLTLSCISHQQLQHTASYHLVHLAFLLFPGCAQCVLDCHELRHSPDADPTQHKLQIRIPLVCFRERINVACIVHMRPDECLHVCRARVLHRKGRLRSEHGNNKKGGAEDRSTTALGGNNQKAKT